MENIPLSTFLALLLIGLSHSFLAVLSFKVGATGMTTVAMAKHFFGMLWPLMVLAIARFCITRRLHEPAYLTRLCIR